MNRIFIAILAFAMIFSLGACGEDKNAINDKVQESTDNAVDKVTDEVNDVLDPDAHNYADDGVIDDNGVHGGVITDEGTEENDEVQSDTEHDKKEKEEIIRRR